MQTARKTWRTVKEMQKQGEAAVHRYHCGDVHDLVAVAVAAVPLAHVGVRVLVLPRHAQPAALPLAPHSQLDLSFSEERWGYGDVKTNP